MECHVLEMKDSEPCAEFFSCSVFRASTVDILEFHVDGLVQERRNSSALAMELRLSCTNPLI